MLAAGKSTFQKFPKMLAAGKRALPKFSKNVSSWKTLLFPNFTEAGKPTFGERSKEKFFQKRLDKNQKYDILKLEKMRKGKCENGKI